MTDEQSPLLAIQMLVNGKNDTDLLMALVSALSDNQYALISKLAGATNYAIRDGANVMIAKTIVECVLKRATIDKPQSANEE